MQVVDEAEGSRSTLGEVPPDHLRDSKSMLASVMYYSHVVLKYSSPTEYRVLSNRTITNAYQTTPQ